MNRSNIAFYDAFAPFYERVYGCVDAKETVRQWLLLLAELTIARPSSQRRPRLLDLGCGPGWHMRSWHEAGFDVVGADVSAQMLILAEQTRRAGTHCELVLADARSLPRQLGPFDLVVGHFRLLNLVPPEELPRLFTSVSRVLGPGGAFVADRSPQPGLLEPMSERVEGLLHSAQLEAPDIVLSTWELPDAAATEHYWLHSDELIQSCAMAAGLSSISRTWSPDEPSDPWRQRAEGGAFVSVFQTDRGQRR